MNNNGNQHNPHFTKSFLFCIINHISYFLILLPPLSKAAVSGYKWTNYGGAFVISVHSLLKLLYEIQVEEL